MQKNLLVLVALAVLSGTIILIFFNILPGALAQSKMVYVGTIFIIGGLVISFVGRTRELKPSFLIVQNVSLISGTILVILASLFILAIEQIMNF